MPWEATGEILSRKVLPTDLSFHKMFQNCGPRWCKLERWLRGPSMSLHPANLFTCPDQVLGNQCPDTGPSLSKPVPGLQVLQLEHSHGHQPPPPPKGASSLHLLPLQGDPTPIPFCSASCLCSCCIVCLVGACLTRVLTWGTGSFHKAGQVEREAACTLGLLGCVEREWIWGLG